jgi:glutamine amidotransferase-like uncharacterized protein
VPQRRAGEEVHGRPATLRITTAAKNERKGERVALRARQHRRAVAAVLKALGLLDAESGSAAATQVFGPRQRSGPRVGIFDDDGAVSSSGHDPLWIVRSVRHLPLDVTVFDAVDVANGALARCDVVVFGGGSSRRQGLALGEAGRARVRAFVRRGGGFVGLCAGGFLASTSRDRYLGLLDFDVDGTRGSGVVPLAWNMALADQHGIEGTRPTKFSGGPLIEIDEMGPGVEVWATFAEDLAREEREALPLKGTAAAVAGSFGDGRVVAFSPHPERAPGPQEAFWNAIFWTAQASRGSERAAAVEARAAE